MSARSLTKITDFTAEEVLQLFEWAGAMRKDRMTDRGILNGKVMALFSEKPSLRTRFTFEVGMYHLGGTSVFLTNQDINIGKREPVKDVARNLERWADVIVARTKAQSTIEQLAAYGSIPVVNALSDEYHPCQAVADLFTLWFMGEDLQKTRIAYVGDGNNVCHSLMLLSAMLGASIVAICPEGYDPNLTVVKEARALARSTGAEVLVERDPNKGVKDATAIYTDVWASMGQEAEAEERKRRFVPYQVNGDLVRAAGSDPYIMHCLPAHRDEEITDEVMESKRSIVFEQAENRLHAQKAILKFLMT